MNYQNANWTVNQSWLGRLSIDFTGADKWAKKIMSNHFVMPAAGNHAYWRLEDTDTREYSVAQRLLNSQLRLLKQISL